MFVTSTAVCGEIGCGSPARSAMRARDADRPVGAGRDHAVDRERVDEALDRGLVLGREDAAPVGEPEAGRGRIAIDDGEPEATCPGGLEQPELCGPGA